MGLLLMTESKECECTCIEPVVLALCPVFFLRGEDEQFFTSPACGVGNLVCMFGLFPKLYNVENLLAILECGPIRFQDEELMGGVHCFL